MDDSSGEQGKKNVPTPLTNRDESVQWTDDPSLRTIEVGDMLLYDRLVAVLCSPSSYTAIGFLFRRSTVEAYGPWILKLRLARWDIG